MSHQTLREAYLPRLRIIMIALKIMDTVFSITLNKESYQIGLILVQAMNQSEKDKAMSLLEREKSRMMTKYKRRIQSNRESLK